MSEVGAARVRVERQTEVMRGERALSEEWLDNLDQAPFVIVIMAFGTYLIVNSMDYSDFYYLGFILMVTATYAVASSPPKTTDTRARGAAFFARSVGRKEGNERVVASS